MNFATTDALGELAYRGSHSAPLVVVSLAIAILAAYASISHVDLIRNTTARAARIGWQINGAIAMGVGVWTMHFIGMVAFQLPLEIEYHLGITMASVLPAIAAGYVALQVLRAPCVSVQAIALGGSLMGVGIGAMHYIGMSGMIVDADMLHQPALFALSIAVAIIMASMALAIPRLLDRFLENGERYQPTLFKLGSAVLMGLAISSLHYVAMSAARFVPGDGQHSSLAGLTVQPGLIAGLAVGASLFILITSTITVTLRLRIEGAQLDADILAARARQLDDRFQKIASRLPGVVYQFRLGPDGSLSFPYASHAIEDIYGVTAEQVQEDASELTNVIHPADLDGVLASIQASANDLSVWRHEYRVRHPEHGERWLQGNATPDREPDGGVLWNGFITDITDQKRTSARIHQLAFYDELTGLANRRLLEERLEHARALSARHRHYGAVLFLDLDDFKRLNDTLGHSVGDALLKTLARRLEHHVRSADTVARLGGDEFVIVLEKLGEREDLAAQQAAHMAEEVQALVTEPVQLRGHDYQCAVSIGLTVFLGDEHTHEELLRRADAAMYQAKAAGFNAIRFFNPTLQAEMEERFRLEADLRASMGSDHFVLHFQRQVGPDGHTVAAEALLRWHHPVRGLVAPLDFMPLAEDTGLIRPLGHWVLNEGCRQIQRWQQDPATAHLSLSVNVSAAQFHQDDFVSQIERLLEGWPIPPERLKLELTESLVLADLEDSMYKMEQIRALGIRFSMDDFGTGYSSMAYLSRLPFDEVKIDKAFVQAAGQSGHGRDRVIIEAIINLAQSLDMRVVAEGVETAEQFELLAEIECHYFQGYYFGRPGPATAIMG
ncbi:hypothetical protein TVD_13340 [Thioalkalivibrio versutus]|uniref:Diguanylate cyclase n=1 Tax=Thioalkalivibrio versutus TaxID=106634 RepID=A0A0G3G4W9_9GAMM|nr:EAL domain-containing protein [Thioalkalivibrio versutus]AKJ96283.1 hypothetical protein TVD_13340 [Thioalkalivibrio versutus]